MKTCHSKPHRSNEQAPHFISDQVADASAKAEERTHYSKVGL